MIRFTAIWARFFVLSWLETVQISSVRILGCQFYYWRDSNVKAASRLLLPSVDTEQTKSLWAKCKVVPDTHNLLLPDTQITRWRGTEVLNRPANITVDDGAIFTLQGPLPTLWVTPFSLQWGRRPGWRWRWRASAPRTAGRPPPGHGRREPWASPRPPGGWTRSWRTRMTPSGWTPDTGQGGPPCCSGRSKGNTWSNRWLAHKRLWYLVNRWREKYLH